MLATAVEAERKARVDAGAALVEAGSRLAEREMAARLDRAARDEAEAALVEAQTRLAALMAPVDVEMLSCPEPEAGPPVGRVAPTASADDPLIDQLRHGGMVLGDATLFASGEADLTAGGRRELAGVADELGKAIAEMPAGTPWTLHVEGHTDDRPVVPGGRWSSNWALSAARASTIAEYLIDRGMPADRLVAVGLADTRPVVAGSSAAGARSEPAHRAAAGRELSRAAAGRELGAAAGGASAAVRPPAPG